MKGEGVMKPKVLVLFIYLTATVSASAQTPSPLASAIAGPLPPLADAVQADRGSGVRPLELKWEELAPVVRGHVVELSLSGADVRGEVISVRDDGLLMDVRHTSNSGAVGRGSLTIPRTSIRQMRLRESRGSWGRHLGTTIGVISGVIVGLWIAANVADSANVGIPLWAGLASGMTFGGYQLGKAADTRTIEIRV